MVLVQALLEVLDLILMVVQWVVPEDLVAQWMDLEVLVTHLVVQWEDLEFLVLILMEDLEVLDLILLVVQEALVGPVIRLVVPEARLV